MSKTPARRSTVELEAIQSPDTVGIRSHDIIIILFGISAGLCILLTNYAHGILILLEDVSLSACVYFLTVSFESLAVTCQYSNAIQIPSGSECRPLHA